MTRIISGRLRGLSITVPPAGTRPTTDRVREALFSAIDSRVDLDGAAVLDLFAGSGALGLEALSRGADTAWFVEENPRAVACLKKNTAGASSSSPSLRTTVRRAALPAAVEGDCPVPGGFHLVLADPPYERSAVLDEPVLAALLEGGWLAEDALVVWERSKRDPAVRWPAGYDVIFERTYGETTIEMARPVDTVAP
ncbi:MULTISPECIES: 16S rRNA (guanine(966)-N(2))-methyltransferase RsmD [Dietzia]|uniref:16S rRNA (Guanine(966)-N(2))-methyltransferase RsmD n=1 Tax=Dietzia cinnamea TaxID=321318 RepID=A0AAW5Q673_9ACTN|nr:MULTISPECIES: 16S rRNA (guanine(966)-N(2))-methyltransferase RsmD [Dietzia]PWD94978.1 16S rRNA (guanine(966)-N(2))-methyltransferase RsmD [Dietzia maris]MBM7229877.1 16S rRNA (guanine(966)-N(2))-methyltransferase RsmD [Dietzia cinnamea]MCT1641023.1 16S rRNA (guanine(966)-N(2))-methyltransferase RsmD [Dietzia cinnamea]MCT1713028.1 16S rRNA (guanine(966)-N(2))-methyltransferase RsmD [Dietzia cinnamea]MCT1864102.1 16S rRNA (guanine(966)-N(2))-methyltransferase RsmD [Dietzia cinnamea]